MGHERQILLPAALYFERLLSGKGRHGRADRSIPIREVVYTTAQDVVLSNDLLDIVSVFDSLQPVRRWAAFDHGLRNRLVRVLTKRIRQLYQERRNMVIQCRRVEIPRGG